MTGARAASLRPSSCRRRCAWGPCGCARWSWCADRGPGGPGGGGDPGSCRSRSCGGCRPGTSRRRSPSILKLASIASRSLTSSSSPSWWTRGSGLTPVAARVLGAGTADAVDVGECDLDALVAREVDTNEACHLWWFLSVVPEVWCSTGPARPGPVLGLRAEGDVPRHLRLPGDPSGVGCCVLHSLVRVLEALWTRAVRSRGGAASDCSALALLVARVLADHHDAAVATDHLALVTDLLDARVDLHVAFAVSSMTVFYL